MSISLADYYRACARVAWQRDDPEDEAWYERQAQLQPADDPILAELVELDSNGVPGPAWEPGEDRDDDLDALPIGVTHEVA